MTQRTTIPDDVKAAALADLVFMSYSAVAAKYRLNPKTVSVWKSRELPATLQQSTHAVELKKDRIAALALEYLEANLNAQIAQAYVTSDPNYINRQPAGEVAILHGVLNDKALRLLEALQPRGEQSDV